MEGKTSSSSQASFRIPKTRTNTKSEHVQVQSPLARIPDSQHWDYHLKEWKLSPNSRKSSRKGKRKKDGDKHNCNDEDSIGSPSLTWLYQLKTKKKQKQQNKNPKQYDD